MNCFGSYLYKFVVCAGMSGSIFLVSVGCNATMEKRREAGTDVS